MHDRLTILMLDQYRDVHQDIECFKQLNNHESSLKHLFNEVEKARTFNKDNVKVPDLRTTARRKSFAYRGPAFWNGISANLKEIETVNAFTNAYTKEILRDVNHPGYRVCL